MYPLPSLSTPLLSRPSPYSFRVREDLQVRMAGVHSCIQNRNDELFVAGPDVPSFRRIDVSIGNRAVLPNIV